MSKINGAIFGRELAANNLSLEKLATGPRAQLLSNYMSGMYGNTFIRDDFGGAVISGVNWAVGGDSGTTTLAIAAAGSQVGVGGGITGSTATDDNEAIYFRGHPVFKGDNNAGFLITATITGTLTDLLLEMGFTDPLSDDTLPAINDIDTPTITNGAVTVAVIAADTDQTLATATRLILDGDSTYASASVAPSAAWFPTTQVPFTALFQTEGDRVEAWVFENRKLKAFYHTTAKAFEGGTYVNPWFIVGNREASNAKTVTVHRAWAWCDSGVL